MFWMSRPATPRRTVPSSPVWSLARPVTWALLALVVGGAACSDDEDDGNAVNPGTCEGGGGPVASTQADDHCIDSSGNDIIQEVGMCRSSADVEDAAGDEEEEYGVYFGNETDDDDCKYHVSFTNTCIQLNQPVTFTVQVRRKSDGAPASGAQPSHPEIYMEDDNHPSPSNRIDAPEGPDGTYKIGPIVFDRSGRWVVRFHFFETCSDIPEDSPHGHAGFYIDVP